MSTDSNEGEIKNFYNIFVWQEAHKLVVDIYRITKIFPKEETYGLVSQLRRAAVSITSNIAEGFSRKSLKEKAQFMITQKHQFQKSKVNYFSQKM